MNTVQISNEIMPKLVKIEIEEPEENQALQTKEFNSRFVTECVVCGSGEDSQFVSCLTEVWSWLNNKDEHLPSRNICSQCHSLVYLLVKAEDEYFKLKSQFEQIISKNPFYTLKNTINKQLKDENSPYNDIFNDGFSNNESDDEPLAVTKSKRKVTKAPRKKKKNKENKSWECNDSRKDGNALEHSAEVNIKSEDNQVVNNEKIEIEISMKIETDETANKDNGPTKKKMDKSKKTKQNATFECDQCKAVFSTMTRLQRHRSSHDSGPPYICEICGVHYKNRRACDVHVGMHKGIGQWKCEQCDRLFPSKSALRRHNNIHTGKLNYQCDQCGKSFIHTSSFKMHKLSHSGVKPHVCPQCGLALLTSSHLKRHLRVHSGEKRFACSTCGKAYSERYNLNAHARSHLPKENETILNTKEPIGRFRCMFCNQRFQRRFMLERHSSEVHDRTLERSPATPRNTLTKIMRAMANNTNAKQPPLQTSQAIISVERDSIKEPFSR